MVQHLTDVANYISQLTAANPGTGLMQQCREFLYRSTVHPANPTTDLYYANVTAPKAWDTIMTDMWRRIPAVSDWSRPLPSVLCYDVSDLMVMILGTLGIQCRTVRICAGHPAMNGASGAPLYLDHTLVECWTGSMWAVQDAFYNVEYLKPAADPTGPWASIDELCSATDLLDFTPQNFATSGWLSCGVDILRTEDFFCAIEHRDAGVGTLNPIVNGASTSFTGTFSLVNLNHTRADTFAQFYNPNTQANATLQSLVINYTRHSNPVVIDRIS